MKKLILSLLILALIASTAVRAQEAPTPNKAPRTPVHRQTLPDRKDQVAETREVQGSATIIDSERLRIGDVELRLFGIVPPQLSASFGPQARAALDQITLGKNIDCQVHDRDHDGRFLATCKNDSDIDLGLELLRRGLAVTARGSLTGTEWAQPYIAAEQAAMTQKIGLWSTGVPTPALVPVVIAAVPTTTSSPAPSAVATKIEKVENIPPPLAPSEFKEPAAKVDTKTEKPTAKPEENKTKPELVAPTALTTFPPKVATAVDNPEMQTPGFIARYQILIAGFLMLITALGILATIHIRRAFERREEMRALAAALRGELMAARAVCQARLKTILTEQDDRNMIWPRIRATLYQAYVGRLGALGAELARQIASIYGQTSDYAAYYAAAEEHAAMPKRQALETLTQHIEAVLPRLGGIEETGIAPRGNLSYASPMPVMTVIQNGTSTSSIARIQPPQTQTATVPTAEAVPPGAADAPSGPENDKNYNRAASPIPLWKAMRNFTREKLVDKNRPRDPMEDQFPDYASMLDEEMADISFTEGEGDDEPPNNATKFRAS